MTTRLTEPELKKVFRNALGRNCSAIIVAEFGDFECDEDRIEGDNFVINVTAYELKTYVFNGMSHFEVSSLEGMKLYYIPIEHIAKIYLVHFTTGEVVKAYDFTHESEVLREKNIYCESDSVKSILGYQGNKFNISQELFDLMPDKINRFYDVFGGSAVMSASAVKRSEKVVYNDYDKNIVRILKYLRSTRPNRFIKAFDKCVKDNGLQWDKKSPKSVAKCKANYYTFRDKVNATTPVDPFHAIVLSKHAYCSLFRFSLKKNEFNYAYGERSWRKSEARDNVIYDFMHALKEIKINRSTWQRFTQRILEHYQEGDFVYFDPPYLASGYNVYKGSWSEKDEIDILRRAKELDKHGVKVMISNVLTHRGLVNENLAKFIKISGFRCINISEGKELYSISRITTDDEQKTVEVALINY